MVYTRTRTTQTLHESKCLGEVTRGTREYLIKMYSAKGYEAERAGDRVKAQLYFNHEEHWKRHDQT